MNIILNLLLINLIVALVWNSGFWTELDNAINKKFKLYHLPAKPFMCTVCQCFWLSIIALLFWKELSLLTIVYSLINGHLTKISVPLLKTIENYALKIIEIMNRICD